MVLVIVALWLLAAGLPLPAGAVFAAAVLVKLDALIALPTVVALIALERRRLRAAAEAAAGAVVLVAVVALVFVRDLGGIWSGAVSYHLTSRRITGLIGRHQVAGFFAVKTPFLWLTILAALVLPLAWRRSWPYWVWGLCALLFVLRYQPLRDNNVLVLPYAFAVPAGISLGLAVQRLRLGLVAAVVAAGALALAAGWIQQLHRVRLDAMPEDPGARRRSGAPRGAHARRRPRSISRPADRRLPRAPPHPAAARRHGEPALRHRLAHRAAGPAGRATASRRSSRGAPSPSGRR